MLGSSGTDVVSKIHNSDDHIDSLKGFEASQFYDRMRRSDPQIKKILGAINNPIRSAKWSVEAAGDEEQDLKAAQLINQILFKDLNWTKFINEALTMVPHGFSIFEVVHMNRDEKELGAYTGLAQLGFRKQSTITEWLHNEVTGELESVRQEASGDIKVNAYIPSEFLLKMFSEQEGDNIGFPLLRVLFGPYKRKLIATELQYIGIERFAIPTPVLEVPNNISQTDVEYTNAVEVLQNFTSAEDSFITHPKGWSLTLNNNVFDPEKIKSIIKAEDESMSGAILATFLELGVGGNGGAFALGNDLSDFFLSGLEYYANIVRDTINKELIPSLIKLNYGDSLSAIPKLAYSGISDKAGKELMEIITGYTASGVVQVDEPLEDHVRKAHNLPPKVEGEMVDNGAKKSDEPSNEPDPEPDKTEPVELKLAESLGHSHSYKSQRTGPAIKRGQKHYHKLLDSDGNEVGQTKTEKETPEHKHEVEAGLLTSKPIEFKELSEPKNNPKALIESYSPKVAAILRSNLSLITDKYIADVMNKYKRLNDNQKLKAVKDIKIGGVNKLKKELKGVLTSMARESEKQARLEVPEKQDVKLKSDMDAIKLEFKDADTFKFNEFSSLPKRIQLLIAMQAGLISSTVAEDAVSSVAFQFGSSEASTNDIKVLEADLIENAGTFSSAASRDVTATNASSLMVNEARNAFLMSPEVSEGLSSYTFINADPKTDVCKAMQGTTYFVEDQDIVRMQPPLHHNCKSYIRANLKTSRNVPDVTGIPELSESAKKSITLKEGL